MIQFDIIEYLSGLTSFVFDKAILKRVAFERGVQNVVDYAELDGRTKDLLLADLLLVAYLSPNTIASYTEKHGDFQKSIGQQVLTDKDSIYNYILGIYRKYEDEKINALPCASGTLQWME